LSPSAIPELAKVFAAVKPISSWQTLGPLPIDDPAPFAVDPIDLNGTVHAPNGKYLSWWKRSAVDSRGQMDLNKCFKSTPDSFAAFAYAEIDSPIARKAQVVAGSDDTLTIWINGAKVYDFNERRGYDPEAVRFDVDLTSGVNRILVKCGNRGGPWQFSLGLSSPTDYAFLKQPDAGAFNPDAYRQFALSERGSTEKGKALFSDPKGLNCVKCHALKGQGGAVGPDLSDIGARYPKDDIVQSILYPSAKIFSGYEPVTIATNDGRVLGGVIKNETADAITLQDADAKTTTVAKAEIEERKVSDVSIMPNGLAEGLSKQDFADLVSFLETLKDKPPAKP
jgi:putative heme-binding domain-containing protein